MASEKEFSEYFKVFKNPEVRKKMEEEVKKVPYDPRFPNMNQTRNCQQNYLDYHRCIKKKGEDYEPCNWYKNAYLTICPEPWFEKWDEQISNRTFPFPEVLPEE